MSTIAADWSDTAQATIVRFSEGTLGDYQELLGEFGELLDQHNECVIAIDFSGVVDIDEEGIAALLWLAEQHTRDVHAYAYVGRAATALEEAEAEGFMIMHHDYDALCAATAA